MNKTFLVDVIAFENESGSGSSQASPWDKFKSLRS